MLMCGAVGSRGRRRRRQGTRCEGYCEAMPSALLTAPCPRQSPAIHMRSTPHRVRVRMNDCAAGLRGLGCREILISSQDLIDGGSFC